MPNWTVGASRSLDIVSRNTWDGPQARRDIVSFYENDEGEVDQGQARRGFLIYDTDSDGNDLQDYAFPFADIVDGELKAITAGIVAADTFIGRGPDGAPSEAMQDVVNEYRRRSEDLADPEEDSEASFTLNVTHGLTEGKRVAGVDTSPPDRVANNARKALRWREETGNPNDCGTRVGWTRANQLAKQQQLSEDILKRMRSFLARHLAQVEGTLGEQDRESCQRMMIMAWGGKAGLRWAETTLDRIESAREEDSQDAPIIHTVSKSQMATSTQEISDAKTDVPYETHNAGLGAGSVKDVDPKNGIVTGYFASWGTVDADNDAFVQGAFEESIRQDGPNAEHQRIKHLFQHSPEGLIGKPHVLREDDFGLYFETEIVKTSLGEDVLKMYQANLFEHSVGFFRKGEEQEDDVTLITKAKLMEGSAVTWGANPMTPFTGFKSVTDFADHLSQKARSLRRLLSEDVRDVRMEQVELGLKQLESSLATLEKYLDEGEADPANLDDDVKEEMHWPPDVNLTKTTEKERVEWPPSPSFD